MFFDKNKNLLNLKRYSISVFNICIPQKIKFWHAANLQNRIRESDIAFGSLFFFPFSLLCTQYKQIYALNLSQLNLSHLSWRILNQVNYWWMFEISCSVFYKICANDFLMGSSQDEKNKQNNIRKINYEPFDREKVPT